MAASRSVSITYVPADCGSIIPGKSKAPKAFQDVGIVNQLRYAGFTSITEQHPLDSPATYSATTFEPDRVRNETLNVSVLDRVHSSISRNLLAERKDEEGEIPSFQLILGGECCMLPAILTSFWQHVSPGKSVGLIYIDADTDLASPTDPSSTGNFAGMNMTHLLRTHGALDSMKEYVRPNGSAVCDSSNTVLFGVNMANPGNKPEHFAYLFEHSFKVIPSSSVARMPEEKAKEALEWLEERVDVILVHLDVDSIDPGMFPLANVPNSTGVGFEEMMRALEVMMGSKKVAGLCVAEVNPDHDPELRMVQVLTERIAKMLECRVRRRA
jgi:arginase